MPVLALLLLFGTACTRSIGPDGWAAPFEAGDLTIVQDNGGHLIALSLSGGSATVQWRFPDSDLDNLNLRAIYGTPVLDGDVIYAAGYSGHVFALDRATGRPLADWAGPVDLKTRIVAGLGYDGEWLYVATEDGRVVTIDAATGALGATILEVDERLWARPILSADTIYVAGLDKEVHALDRSSGATRWVHDFDGAIAGDVTLDDGVLYVGALDSTLTALDVERGGEARWQFSGDGWFWADPLVVGDSVYAATMEGNVYAIDRVDGSELWSFRGAGKNIRARPALLDGVLVVVDRDGFVYGLDPASGEEQWRVQLEGERLLADPLMLESTILYGSTRGDLIEVRPAAGTTRTLYERS